MIKRLLNTIANRNVSRKDIDVYRKRIMIMLVLLIGIVALFIMGIIVLIRGDILLASVNLALILLLSLTVFLMWKQRKYKLYGTIIITILGLFFLYLFVVGDAENNMQIWCLMYPVLAAFLVSYKKGRLHCIMLMFLLAVSQLLAHFSVVSFIYRYSISNLIRFFIVYGIITFVSCIAEWARTFTYAKLEKYYESMQHTIHELECARARLRELTNIDPLTEIYNKRYLTASSKELVNKGEAKFVVSMFFDIDDFKKYNDHYGHIEGDKVLVKVVEIIKRQIRSSDGIFARFGGEEMVYLMKTNDIGRVEAIAKRIIAAFKNNKIEHVYSKTGYVTVSIGIAYCLKKDFTAWKPVVSQSDAAMYQAKRKGKNTYYIA